MNKEIEDILAAVLQEAAKKRAALPQCMACEDAAFLETQVKFFRYGQMGIIPPEWDEHRASVDPEFKTYLRLKSKYSR